MSEKFSKAALDAIEEMAEMGFTLQEIGEQFGMTARETQAWKAGNLEIASALKRGQEKSKMRNLDQARSDRLGRLASWFIPTVSELEEIESLCRMGWAEYRIAERYDISPSVFAKAKSENAELKSAIERGQAQAEGKFLKAHLDSYRPTPEDLKMIEEFAGRGLTYDSIAAEMNLPPKVFHAKKDEIPEIAEAFHKGFATLKAKIEAKITEKALAGNERLLPYWLKARDKDNWVEAPAAKPTSAPSSALTQPPLKLPVPGDDKAFEADSAKYRKQKRIADANE